MPKLGNYEFMGSYRACHKCGEKSYHATACQKCLDAMRAHHEKYEEIWDIEPDKHSTQKYRNIVVAMRKSGMSHNEIAKQIIIPAAIVKSIILETEGHL